MRAAAWYWRLGFVATQLYIHHFSQRCRRRPVVYLRMRCCVAEVNTATKVATACVPQGRFFGSELCREQVLLLPRRTPNTRLWTKTKTPHAPVAAFVCAYDGASGLHQLCDGRATDLTIEFAHGRVRFAKPLHLLLARSPEFTQSPIVAASSSGVMPSPPASTLASTPTSAPAPTLGERGLAHLLPGAGAAVLVGSDGVFLVASAAHAGTALDPCPVQPPRRRIRRWQSDSTASTVASTTEETVESQRLDRIRQRL